jgi:prolyl oligopeptidase
MTTAQRHRISYPPAQESRTSERFHGLDVPDPFDWLEDGECAQTRTWLAAQRELTRSELAGLPQRARVLAELDAVAAPVPGTLPVRRPTGEFNFGRSANGGATLVRSGAGDVEVVLDPAGIAEIRHLRLHPEATYFGPSGKLVALGLSEPGSDWRSLRIFDLESRELQSHRWPETAHLVVEWFPDESGFVHGLVRRRLRPEPGGSDGWRDGVYLHRIGKEPADDELLFDHHDAEAHAALPLLIRDGRVLLIKTLDFVTQKAALLVKDLQLASPAHQALPYLAPFNVIGEHGTEIFVETRWGAGRGRILAADPTDTTPRWREVVPEQADSLAIAPHSTWSPLAALTGGRLFATYLRDAAHRLVVFDTRTGAADDIPLPDLCTVLQLRAAQRTVEVALTTFTTPFARYSWSPDGLELQHAAGSSPTASPHTEQIFCTSEDGTRVPAFVIRGKAATAAAPTLLYGYGGWGSSLTPKFRSDVAAWLALGGTYVVANIRGGGEYGEDWHAAGARLNRRKTFEDFCAVGVELIARGICPPSGLAARGASNGALLVAASVQFRPELFAAAVAEVPLLDVVHLKRLPAGAAIAAELGDPEADRDTFEYLLGYSPLQNVRRSPHRPAMLLAPAERDERVSPAQTYKFVASLQQTAGPGQVALLRVIDGEGHTGWSWESERNLLADELAFLWEYVTRGGEGASR